MPLDIITPPGVEPVSTTEAKVRLRIDHTDEDSLIAALITAARVRVEALTGHALITQRLRETRDGWGAGDRAEAGAAVLRLARGPVSTLHHVKTIDEDGTETSLDLGKIALDGHSAPGRVSLMTGACWPDPGRPLAGIQIEYDAGYGAAASDAPEPLREAVQLLVAEAYEGRVPPSADAKSAAQLSPRVAGLLAPYRTVRL